MGQMYVAYVKSPDTVPKPDEGPTFDPLYGFSAGRKERQMKVTEEEMEAAGLIATERDYCAHALIDFVKCRKQKFPYIAACKHEKHLWEECQFDDYVLRMKEYERERRLRERRKKKMIMEGGSGELMHE